MCVHLAILTLASNLGNHICRKQRRSHIDHQLIGRLSVYTWSPEDPEGFSQEPNTHMSRYLICKAWGHLQVPSEWSSRGEGVGWMGRGTLCPARLMLLVKLVSSAEQTNTKTTRVESVHFSSQPVERKFPQQLWSRLWGHQWADFFCFPFKNHAMGLINCCRRNLITDSSSSRPPPERCVCRSDAGHACAYICCPL